MNNHNSDEITAKKKKKSWVQLTSNAGFILSKKEKYNIQLTPHCCLRKDRLHVTPSSIYGLFTVMFNSMFMILLKSLCWALPWVHDYQISAAHHWIHWLGLSSMGWSFHIGSRMWPGIFSMAVWENKEWGENKSTIRLSRWGCSWSINDSEVTYLCQLHGYTFREVPLDVF